jgi:1-deoxy-D-xylulose-5-phosphate synthase
MLAQTATKNLEKLIDSVNLPSDIRNFSIPELKQLADELREEIVHIVSHIGGHLGAGLGVVELTVALHHVFNTPHDQLLWDIGHQAYPHKYLTGRKDRLHTIRQPGGLSGFLKRSESEYDVMGAGHSSTAISTALGIAVARDLKGEDYNVVAVIGDGAITAGMAYEAMNNAGHLRNKMIVILNDNDMSIAPNVGAMQSYLNKLMSSKQFLSFRAYAKHFINKMPHPIESFTKKAKKYAKGFIQGGNFFEEIGFHYVGPLDGHNLDELVPILQNLRDDKDIESPILVHIKTQKGKGFTSPVTCAEHYHSVTKFDLETKIQIKGEPKYKTYTKVFGETLSALANVDSKIVAITAAMPSGTGLDIFAKNHGDRTFDVGIAEQHAVTFATGLAIQGLKPFCAIYSTFLQRAFDQVVHDVAIQNLPVRFAIDRAGLVGGDGPTHAGSFDITYLAMLPNFVVMAAADEEELARMILTASEINDRPSAFR